MIETCLAPPEDAQVNEREKPDKKNRHDRNNTPRPPVRSKAPHIVVMVELRQTSSPIAGLRSAVIQHGRRPVALVYAVFVTQQEACRQPQHCQNNSDALRSGKLHVPYLADAIKGSVERRRTMRNSGEGKCGKGGTWAGLIDPTAHFRMLADDLGGACAVDFFEFETRQHGMPILMEPGSSLWTAAQRKTNVSQPRNGATKPAMVSIDARLITARRTLSSRYLRPITARSPGACASLAQSIGCLRTPPWRRQDAVGRQDVVELLSCYGSPISILHKPAVALHYRAVIRQRA